MDTKTVDMEEKKNKIPNFFVVGAPKSGTTSLYFYLKQHKDIYLSPIKEPVFFARDIVDNVLKCKKDVMPFNPQKYFSHKKLPERHIAFIKEEKHYLELFREIKNEKVAGECCTFNLFSKVAAFKIRKFNPEAKIIAILRNPVDRTFSHYQMKLLEGTTKEKDFLKEVLGDFKSKSECKTFYIEQGMYYEQLKRYYDSFPKSNIKVFIFEEFINNIDLFLSELFDFLGVANVVVRTHDVYNKSATPKFVKLNYALKKFRRKTAFLFPDKMPDFLKKIYDYLMLSNKKQKLDIKTRARLYEFFKEDILKTQQLTGKDLSLWMPEEK